MALLSGKGQVKYHRTGRGKGQVKYHRKSKQKWKQGTGQISPGNRRLEFGDGRNWEAAFSPEPPPEVSEPADAPSVHTAIDSVPINSASRHGSPSSRRRPASGRQPSTRASGCVETQPTQSSYLAPKLGRAANEFDSSRTEHLGRTD